MHLLCPQCGSKSFKRNGYTRHGKQNHRCFDCGRQFSLDTFYVESEEKTMSLQQQCVGLTSLAEGAY